jgi:hypothetical protein
LNGKFYEGKFGMQFATPAKLGNAYCNLHSTTARQPDVGDETEAPEISGYHRKDRGENLGILKANSY